MSRQLFISFVLYMFVFNTSFSQSLVQAPVSTYSYHPASADKPSWQRLNLWLSSVYYRSSKQSRVDMDSCMIYTSKSLGISRLSFTAEGIDDEELLAESQWFDKRDPGKGIRSLSLAKGKKHLELMILLGSYYAFQPATYKRYKDSVEYFLKNAITESKTIGEKRLGRIAACLLGKMYALGSDTVNSSAVFSKLIDECRHDADKVNEARAFAYRGIYSSYPATSLQEKLGYLQNAAEIYHKLGDVESEVGVSTNISFLYLASYKLEDAYKGFTKTLQLENNIGYPYTHYTTQHLAMLTFLQGKFGEPLKYALVTIKTAETIRDSICLPATYLILGELYTMETGREEEALKWMLKALDRYISINDGNAYTNLTNVVLLMTIIKGREKEALDLVLDISKKMSPGSVSDQVSYNLSFAACYLSLKQYKLSEAYIAKADSLQKISPPVTIAGTYMQSYINNLRISLLIAKGEFAIAKKYIEDEFADSLRVPILAGELANYQRLITIDAALHDDPSAVKHYEKLTELTDSNFRISRIRQAEELQVMYETEEKQNQIISLNKQATLERSNLKQANLVKNLTIAGIIAVLIIAILLYRQNRLKQKNNIVISSQNEQLKHFLVEKDWLVKEIHHRVKNNLQTVMGLLATQSGYLTNDVAINAITDSQRRIQSMSLIHQRLYQSNNISEVKMTEYIHELVDSLDESFNSNNNVRFNFEIEPLELDLAHSIPLGLILNEAITNSFKYAFPNNHHGVIDILLKKKAENNYSLIIRDNGAGLPPGFDMNRTNSMGMNLMRGLSAEIGAEFFISSQNGTQVEINFTSTQPKHDNL